MRLLNFLWRKRDNILVFVLSILAITPRIPLLVSGTKAAFFNLDPEVALIGNALSFIKNHSIHYADHPGTPTILFVAISYFPVRVYTKLFEHVNFIVWSFDNLRILFSYTRLIYLGIYTLSFFVFLQSVYRINKKISTVVFAWLFLSTFTYLPNLGGAILSETLSFFLISVWLFIFVSYIHKQDKLYEILLLIVGGIAVANKYNNFPLVLASLSWIFFQNKENLLGRVKKVIKSGILVLISFIVATWQVRSFYLILFKRMFVVLFQSGSAHGDGGTKLIDPNLYSQMLQVLWNSEKVVALAFICSLFLILITLFARKNIKIKFETPIYFLYMATFFSILFIMKYKQIYYQIPNFILLSFIVSYIVDKIPRSASLILCVLLISPAIQKINFNTMQLENSINNSIYLESYISQHKTNLPTLWDFGFSEDFMKIWIRGWSLGIYSEDLKNKRPDLLELKSDNKTVMLDYDISTTVFDTCWDKLYIRKERAPAFLDLYKDKVLFIKPIGNTGIWEIKSEHCNSTKL